MNQTTPNKWFCKETDGIRFAVPDIGNREAWGIQDVINTRWITKGPKVTEFENLIAYKSDCSRAVAYDSCTAAMEMCLRVLGIGEGDEVITTPYTYSATAEVIRNVGAKIVFVDLGEDSFEMDYAKVAAAITKKTKAVMPVDIGGRLCDYSSLKVAVASRVSDFCPDNDIQAAIGRVAIIADAAHSFNATKYHKKSGGYADFTCFSFHVLKTITTGGEGGAVVWNYIYGIDNDALERKFRLLGDHGQTSRNKDNGWEYDIELFGYNSIMTDIDAAMGIRQLDRLDEITNKRAIVTSAYDALFYNCEQATPLIRHVDVNNKSSMHLYPVRIEGINGEEERNKVYLKMKEAGIPCNVHYKPLPMMTAYKKIGFDIKDYPNAYKRFATLLTLPYHTELTLEQQAYIVENLKKAVDEV